MQGSPGEGSNSIRGVRNALEKIIKWGKIWHFCLKKWYAYLWRFITLARRAEMQNCFWPSSSQRNDDSRGGATFVISTFFDCTAGKTVGLPSIFLYFSAVSGSYLRPGRSKWHTLKGQNHLLDVANAGKPWGRVQLHQGGQECIRKDHYFGKITRGREIFSVDLTVCKLQTC